RRVLFRSNAIGVAGTSWSPTLVSIKVLDSNGIGTESSVIQGTDWARQNGIQILLPDLHFPNKSTNLASAFKNAHASGMLIAAPTGVENSTTPFWPASFLYLTEGIGAIQENGIRWNDAFDAICPDASGLGSNYGQQVDLCAPGGNRIVTTRSRATGTYFTVTGACQRADAGGTASAGAAVAGVAALVQSMALSLSGEDLAQVLERTVRDLGPTGRDDEFGVGLVEADAAVGFVNNANVVDRHS